MTMNAQRLLDDALPMLDDMLGRIGVHVSGTPLDFAALLEPFAEWFSANAVAPEDTGLAVMIVGAFITEYLVQQRGATRLVAGERPAVRLLLQPGVAREFDPYSAAAGLVRGGRDLRAFLSAVAG